MSVMAATNMLASIDVCDLVRVFYSSSERLDVAAPFGTKLREVFKDNKCVVFGSTTPPNREEGYETTGYVQVMLYFPQRFACGRQYGRMRWAERIASVLVKGWKDELDG